MLEEEVEVGCNINSPAIAVYHAGLERLNEDSPFRVCCPICKRGIMLVSRNQKTFRLIRADRCTMCGQVFWYLDDKIAGEPLTPIDPKMPENLNPGVFWNDDHSLV